ncbi:hypothetical protein ABZZ36_20585 [Actinacidiphila glaucinigra]
MSALLLVNPAEATGEAGFLLSELRRSVGSVPNMAKAMETARPN